MTSANITLRPATSSDISAMVTLSEHKTPKVQPQFWRRSEKANERQTQWFEQLISSEKSVLLVAEANGQITDFIIGTLTIAPEVYDPGGLTLMIDDFCVEHYGLWNTIGQQLLEEVKGKAMQKGAAQILVVYGHHDDSKRQSCKDRI